MWIALVSLSHVPYHRNEPVTGPGDLVQSPYVLRDKLCLKKEVFGRSAGNGQLREYDEISIDLLRVSEPGRDTVEVTG
jgi:hypothetical protein